jgi:hypothetical protein
MAGFFRQGQAGAVYKKEFGHCPGLPDLNAKPMGKLGPRRFCVSLPD